MPKVSVDRQQLDAAESNSVVTSVGFSFETSHGSYIKIMWAQDTTTRCGAAQSTKVYIVDILFTCHLGIREEQNIDLLAGI
jgi:hypothetical protein